MYEPSTSVILRCKVHATEGVVTIRVTYEDQFKERDRYSHNTQLEKWAGNTWRLYPLKPQPNSRNSEERKILEPNPYIPPTAPHRVPLRHKPFDTNGVQVTLPALMRRRGPMLNFEYPYTFGLMTWRKRDTVLFVSEGCTFLLHNSLSLLEIRIIPFPYNDHAKSARPKSSEVQQTNSTSSQTSQLRHEKNASPSWPSELRMEGGIAMGRSHHEETTLPMDEKSSGVDPEGRQTPSSSFSSRQPHQARMATRYWITTPRQRSEWKQSRGSHNK